MEQIRSFIAIELPQQLKLELSRLQAGLQTDRPRVKWVAAEGIHLTLKFLGNVPAGKIDAVTQVMTASAARSSPFQLDVGGLGAFPNLKRVQVVWVGLGGQLDRLKSLQQSLESGLEPLGFAAEKRSFSPHLTLARVGNEATPAERQHLGELIAATDFASQSAIRVNGIVLMRSQLTPRGAIYSRMASTQLGGNS